MSPRNRARPLSPHLTIWKWGPHMLVSILHRATGSALAIGGGLLLIWWLVAAANGPDSYAKFVDLMTSDASGRLNILPALVLVGLTWSFFQHMLSGIRHLVLDVGAGYELKLNKSIAIGTIVGSLTLTVLFWAAILARG
jgi:succinate dehydrogenase / fumarate reductase cytochrome b subunit